MLNNGRGSKRNGACPKRDGKDEDGWTCGTEQQEFIRIFYFFFFLLHVLRLDAARWVMTDLVRIFSRGAAGIVLLAIRVSAITCRFNISAYALLVTGLGYYDAR